MIRVLALFHEIFIFMNMSVLTTYLIDFKKVLLFSKEDVVS